MPKPTDYDKTHLRNMAAIGTRIDRIFKKAAEEAAKIGVSIKTPLPDDRIFSFDDYPATRKQIERLMAALQQSMETTIVNGVRSAWTLSNNKNNALVSRIFGDRAKKLSEEEYRRYFTTNGAALDAFLQRQAQGLNLSDRVWKYTRAFKKEIEMGLDLGIRTGQSAVGMAQSLKKYLQYPDKLFRRVRDKHGLLQLSKAAKEFHPGAGVYRSSFMNARRLACTETNIAYRTSDYLRWQQMDFVVGMQVCLSNNHTILLQPGETTDDPTQLRADGTPRSNAVRPLTDICDTLKGRYPKNFKFTGWHPHCRCHAVPILKTEEEMANDTRRLLAGEQPTEDSVNAVRDVPGAFKNWLEANSDRMARAEERGTLPYFIRDNRGIVDRILGMSDNPVFATKIMVGNREYLLKDLIAECRVEPTEKGKIYVHPNHGRGELAENLDFARWRAEQCGEEVILLPNPQGVKSADSYNITRGVNEEYKRASKPTVNAVSQLIRSGKNQADYLIVEPHPDMKVEDLMKGLTERITNGNPPRCANLKEIRIKIGDYEAVYTRVQICSPGFKIKPEDFLNESAFRSQGSSLSSKEAGSISDAKLQNFFGLHKKTPQEIAVERHAKRDAAKIQQAWNERRISNIRQAVSAGFLPKECLNGISGLSQSEFNARVRCLQNTANRHASRTQPDIEDIQTGWNRRIIRKFEKAIDDGLLPKEVRTTLRWMQDSNDLGDFDDFRRKTGVLEAAISRHKSRTPSFIQKIKDWWTGRNEDPEAAKIAEVRKAIDKKKIENLSDVQRIIRAFYNQFPEEFNNVKITITTFNEAPKPGRGFTMGYSRHNIEIAFNTNAGAGYVKESPFDTLVKALNKIRDGKKLTLDQHRSINTVVHELLHQKAGKYVALKPHFLPGDFKRTAMETMNEYASRNTHKRFLQRLGATNLEGHEEILRKGDGYQDWVKRLLEFVDTAKLKHDEVGKQFAETLVTKPYDTMDRELYDFFKSHVDKKNFTQSMDEVLTALECHDKSQKGKWAKLLKQWFP